MIALEPGEKGKICLAKHDGIEGAPYCVVSAISVREHRKFILQYNEMFDLKTGEAIQDRMLELFNEIVDEIVGYSSNVAEDAFSQAGIREILNKFLVGNLLAYEEKKS